MEIQDDPSVRLTGSFTLSAWINMDTIGDRRPIVSKQGNSQRGFLFMMGTDRKLALELFKNQSSQSIMKSARLLNPGQWYHVAATYNYMGDGTSEGRLYIDGVMDGSYGSMIGPPVQNTMSLDIGRYYWSSSYNRHMDGIIDEVHVQGTGVSDDWITAEYENQLEPIAFYNLDDPEEYAKKVREISQDSSAWSLAALYESQVVLNPLDTRQFLSDTLKVLCRSPDKGICEHKLASWPTSY